MNKCKHQNLCIVWHDSTCSYNMSKFCYILWLHTCGAGVVYVHTDLVKGSDALHTLVTLTVSFSL